MGEFITHIIQHWGPAGIVAIAAGWVLYETWKRGKEHDAWLRKQLEASSKSRATTRSDLSEIMTVIKKMSEEHTTFRNEINDRISTIEKKIDKKHRDHGVIESIRLDAISKIAPSIHALINDGLNHCNCDHIAVALLHNGTVALSGIPYIKFGVVAEKYKPLKFPNDADLVSKYRGEDIMSHNRLPACIVQSQNIEFEIVDDSTLTEIDPGIFIKCKNKGIKRIAFEAIRDINGLTTGFMIIYKFDESPFNMDALHSTTSAIEHLYQNMIVSLD